MPFSQTCAPCGGTTSAPASYETRSACAARSTSLGMSASHPSPSPTEKRSPTRRCFVARTHPPLPAPRQDHLDDIAAGHITSAHRAHLTRRDSAERREFPSGPSVGRLPDVGALRLGSYLGRQTPSSFATSARPFPYVHPRSTFPARIWRISRVCHDQVSVRRRHLHPGHRERPGLHAAQRALAHDVIDDSARLAVEQRARERAGLRLEAARDLPPFPRVGASAV